MGQMVSADELAAYQAGRSQVFEYSRGQDFTVLTGQYTSHWTGNGMPGQGAIPGAAVVPTKATDGALANFTNPDPGEFAYLTSIDAAFGPQGTAVNVSVGVTYLMDRLVHSGGLDGTVATPTVNTINTPAIDRGDTTGEGVIGFIECYVQLGNTAVTATVSYTNSAGVAGRTSAVSIPIALKAGRMLLIPLMDGDTGIRSIETVTLSATTGTAGNYGVVLCRRITTLDTKRSADAKKRSVLNLGLKKIEDDACLWLMSVPNNTIEGTIAGGFTIITSGAIPANESTSVAAISALVATRGELIDVNSVNSVSLFTLGAFQSYWRAVSTTGQGAIPSTPDVPTKDTPGAFFTFANPSAGHHAHIYSLDLNTGNPGPVYLYDRLSHMGGLVGNITTPQAVNTAAITRGDLNGKDVVGFIEIYTAIGAVTTTITVSYTNTAGTAGRTTTVTILGNTGRTGRVFYIPLADGDTGIKSIETATLSVSSGSPGNFGFTLGRRVSCIPTTAETASLNEPYIQVGMEANYPKIEPDACVWPVVLSSASASAPAICGGVTVVTTG